MERAKEDIPDLRLVDVGPAACFLCVSMVVPRRFFLGVNMNPKRWLNADPEDALIEELIYLYW